MIKNDDDNSGNYDSIIDMLTMGLPFDSIAQITGASIEEIEKIEKLYNNLEGLETNEYIIDRFEEDTAVLSNSETGAITNILKYKLPKDSKEGDKIKWSGTLFEKIENNTTKSLEERLKNLKE